MSAPSGLVVHITSGEDSDWQMALRNLVNLVQDESVSTPPESMRVVVNGPAVEFFMATAPDADKVTRMAESGVDIVICENTLDRFDYSADALADGVTTIPSGVAEVVRVQQRGATYLKLP